MDQYSPKAALDVLSGLKDFQRESAKYAFHRLYKAEDGTRRFLVADEAGLGKTLVAGAVIAQTIEHLQELDTNRIDIIYICSNQAIARQNVDRIRRQLSIGTRPLAERVTLLPHRLTTLSQPINLVALTPGTSFNSASAEGVVEERIILFRMLSQVWGDLGPRARGVFLGGLKSVKRFREYEYWFSERDFDRSIVEAFRENVGGPDSPLHREFVEVRDFISHRQTQEARYHRRRFIAKLRRRLAHACMDALEPDLVILDEFQRFRHLLNKNTESGELAQRLFEYEDSHTQVRTLLLSATPYKMFTLSEDVEDDHYRDFLNTISFLEGRKGSVAHLEETLGRFRTQLPYLATEGRIDEAAKSRLVNLRDNIQTSLRRVMSRTERRAGDSGSDPMLEVAGTSASLDVDDVRSYLDSRAVAKAVDAPGVMEYWKSTPYLLSFMERYRLPERIGSALMDDRNGDVAELIGKGAGLQFPRQAASRRLPIAGGNGRMRALLSDLRESGLQKLLWLPPSLPSHTLGRDFEDARMATKRLVFSSWAMVPRAIAVMASYDAERRYIPDTARAERYVGQSLRVREDSFSLFSLMVPSTILAESGDPFRHSGGLNPNELLAAVERRIRPLVSELIRDAPKEGSPQQIWYAVAPLLLDGLTAESLNWSRDPTQNSTDADEIDQIELNGWQRLFTRVREALARPDTLGRPPGDLVEVLAALAVGGPGNATLRALSRATSISLSDRELKSQTLRAAWSFGSFFRSPTSEGLLQNAYEPGVPFGEADYYWRRVLAYCLEGGLTDVLSEFFHIISETYGADTTPSVLVNRLRGALRLATGNLDVSEWKKDGVGMKRDRYRMRQHIARRYVSDPRSSADQQESHSLDVVRDAFNSPFWPFVLGTTSVGQEGLDFHWYCHAVVHWNLPSNPVNLEQREGRVNRYHGHAVRKNIAQSVGDRTLQRVREATADDRYLDPWNAAYEVVDTIYGADGGLVPHWVFANGIARVERRVPVLPLSRDVERLEALRRTLAIYRMVFGQPRQDDFLEFILREVPPDQQENLAATLTIDLRPRNDKT